MSKISDYLILEQEAYDGPDEIEYQEQQFNNQKYEIRNNKENQFGEMGSAI